MKCELCLDFKYIPSLLDPFIEYKCQACSGYNRVFLAKKWIDDTYSITKQPKNYKSFTQN